MRKRSCDPLLPNPHANSLSVLLESSPSPHTIASVLSQYQKKSRDNARTPMQWNAQAHGGFTSGNQPWMSVNPNHVDVNASAQIDNPASTFAFWSSMLATRKRYKEVLVYGDFQLLEKGDEKVFSYSRTSADGQTMVVLCNFSGETALWSGTVKGVTDVVLSNYGRGIEHFKEEKVVLAPFEACALSL